MARRFCRYCGVDLGAPDVLRCPGCGSDLRPTSRERAGGGRRADPLGVLYTVTVLVLLGALAFIFYAHHHRMPRRVASSSPVPLEASPRLSTPAVDRPSPQLAPSPRAAAHGTPVVPRPRIGLPSPFPSPAATATLPAGPVVIATGTAPAHSAPLPSRSPTAGPATTPAPPTVPGDPEDAAADRHALSTPPSEERSIEALAAWLARGSRTDRARARAAYCWVAHRIRYDVDTFRKACAGQAPGLSSQQPETVLAGRTAVCQGYSALFQALARRMGLEAEIIHGNCRVSSKRPGQPFTRADSHAWNAVKVGGTWQLLDCTWGSGHLDATSDAYVPKYDPFYFLPRPERLVASHLPLEPRWQLLAKPVTAEEQAWMIRISPAGYAAGLTPVDSSRARLEVQGNLFVRFTTAPGFLLGATLAPLDGKKGHDLEGAVLVEPEASSWLLRAAFPAAGTYRLDVFVGERSGGGRSLSWGTTLEVQARSATSPAAFPVQYSACVERGARLVGPASGRLPAGSLQLFEIAAPGALDVVVFNGGHHSRLQGAGERFRGEARVLPGEVVLAARYDQGNQYQGLVKYEAR